MSCTFDRERLSEYFDGELDAAGRAEAETHISGCSECLRELGEIKATAQLVKTLPVERAPASVAQGVSREIASSPPPGRVHSFSAWKQVLGLATATAAALLIAVNVIYFSSVDESAPPEGEMAKAAPASPPADRAAAAPDAKRFENGPAPALKDERRQLARAKAGNEQAEKDLAQGKPSIPAPAEFKKKREAIAGAPAPAAEEPVTPAPKPAAAPPAKLAKALDSKDDAAEPLTSRDPAASRPLGGAAMAKKAVTDLVVKREERLRRSAETEQKKPVEAPVRLVCVTSDAATARVRILASIPKNARPVAEKAEQNGQQNRKQGAREALTLTLTSGQLAVLQRDLAKGGIALVSSATYRGNAVGGKDGVVAFGQKSGAPAKPEADALKVARVTTGAAKPSVQSAPAAPGALKEAQKAAEEELAAGGRNQADKGNAEATVHVVVIEFIVPPTLDAESKTQKK